MEKTSQTLRPFLIGALVLVAAALAAIVLGGTPKSLMGGHSASPTEELRVTADGAAVLPGGTEIPLPFAVGESGLAGSIVHIGRNVYKVSFPAGTDEETLSEDSIYLVYLPTDTTIPVAAFDDVMSIPGIPGHSVNYYGYRYTSITAQIEKERRDTSEPFNQRFPGIFFASTKAFDDDPLHGNALVDFAESRQITWEPTNDASGMASFAPDNLFVLVVNEPQGVMTVREEQPVVMCGDSMVEGGEQCDDGNQDGADGCDALCSVESGFSCTGSPSVCTVLPICGNTVIESGEQCDDGNQVDTDDCNNQCQMSIPLPFEE